ncbi:MAG: apocytochrome f [Trichodesmium sp. St16_bin2-tuft]|jgi:Membrane proteins related to metalloendopeptidases|nr:apocytochrome f [Trichodesmium sp. St18_bin1]MDE5088623.1 apocytochrome f [Trichodesmium sp. St16_bin2-tuft]MDE5123748.1 apocytochrome f [Trichodesmium sp. St19_bin1]
MSKINLSAMWGSFVKQIAKTILVAIISISLFLTSSPAANAYPFWAQETAPATPREATGRIVCANCHLGAKLTEVEVPQSVLPDTVFKAVVKIPYDTDVQQVLGDGSKGDLNVGAVLMLPEGFKLAPEDRIPEEWQEELADLYFMPYSEEQENILLFGPMPGDEYQEVVFPVLSPDPTTDKSIHFGKYAVHVGGNRGRGQVYPAGNKSNNTLYNAAASGKITDITFEEYVGNQITIETADGETVVDTVPPGPELLVGLGDTVEAGQVITNNPNVGGFGQADTEIVLQDANRVKWLMAFFALVMLAQIMLVLKKKQVEKVQAAEMNF